MKLLNHFALIGFLMNSVSAQAQMRQMRPNHAANLEVSRILSSKLEGGSNSGGRLEGGSNSGGADEPTNLKVLHSANLNDLITQQIEAFRLNGIELPMLAMEQAKELLVSLQTVSMNKQIHAWMIMHTQAELRLEERLESHQARSDLRMGFMDQALVEIKQNTGEFGPSKVTSLHLIAAKKIKFLRQSLFINQSQRLSQPREIQNDILEVMGAELAWDVTDSAELTQRMLMLHTQNDAEALSAEINSLIQILTQGN